MGLLSNIKEYCLSAFVRLPFEEVMYFAYMSVDTMGTFIILEP